MLKKPWVMPNLIKPPKTQRLPDIVTVDEAQRLFSATRTLSYRVFYFTLYSLGLRLGEGLALKVGDIDAERMRDHAAPGGTGTVKELLGHSDVRTTMICTHVLNRGGRGVMNPVDRMVAGSLSV